MKILVTGGAGFIGSNVADYFASRGHYIHLFDNFSRFGAEHNLDRLKEHESVGFTRADIRDADAVTDCVRAVSPDAIIHLAAQVAVTTSVIDPIEDFEINAKGTMNILEAARKMPMPPIMLFSSTNKVYGSLDHLQYEERDDEYGFINGRGGVSEDAPLDFHSPYGCSKGVADQYCLDYHRVYGLKTVVFRQSCIFGNNQYGIEDQGWVAWFLIAALTGKKITIFGNGKQVRDLLHVDDLARVFELAIDKIDTVKGNAFNIGGGPNNKMSILQMIEFIKSQVNENLSLGWSDFRPGDQMIYVSDISKFTEMTGWEPLKPIDQGLMQLTDWIRSNKEIFNDL